MENKCVVQTLAKHYCDFYFIRRRRLGDAPFITFSVFRDRNIHSYLLEFLLKGVWLVPLTEQVRKLVVEKKCLCLGLSITVCFHTMQM